MICDKCGKGQDANIVKFTLVWVPVELYHKWEKWHICPECTESLRDWLLHD